MNENQRSLKKKKTKSQKKKKDDDLDFLDDVISKIPEEDKLLVKLDEFLLTLNSTKLSDVQLFGYQLVTFS